MMREDIIENIRNKIITIDNINRINDCYIRYLFSDIGNEKIVLNFINSVMKNMNMKTFCKVEILNPFNLSKYINSKDFFGEIFVKKNIAEVLEKELSSRNWNRDIINLGSVTDNYQEAEKDYKLMRDVLKLLIRYKTPMCISTKSDLILRDFDLIDELSSIVPVRIATTITALDEKLSSLIEPNVISPERRLNILKEFKKISNTLILIVFSEININMINIIFNRVMDCSNYMFFSLFSFTFIK